MGSTPSQTHLKCHYWTRFRWTEEDTVGHFQDGLSGQSGEEASMVSYPIGATEGTRLSVPTFIGRGLPPPPFRCISSCIDREWEPWSTSHGVVREGARLDVDP